MGFEPLQFANLAGGVFGLVLALAVVRHGRKPSERLFGLLLMCAAVAGIAISIEHTDLAANGLLFDQIATIAGYLAGPIMLCYVRLVVDSSASIQRRDLWHFVPAGLSTLCSVVEQTNLMAWRQPNHWVDFFLAAYAIASIRQYRLSTVKREETEWAGRLLAFFLLCVAAGFVRMSVAPNTWLREVVPTTMTLGFAMFGYFAFARIFAQPSAALRVRRSAAGRQSTEAGTLLAVMGEAKPYRDPALDLAKLASLVGLTRHQLSTLLNAELGFTFAAFLAEYRVADVKSKLDAGLAEHATLESIAASSGFRSRSTFYSAFKAATGMTPTDYVSAGAEPERKVVRSVPIGQA